MAMPSKASLGLDTFKEKFHLYARQFDDIVIIELVCLSIESFSVDNREIGSLDVRNEKPVRPARDDRHLHAGFADRVNKVSISDVRHLARARLRECVVTVSTSEPEKVTVKTGAREYKSFPKVDLTPRGVQHDTGGGNK